MSFFNFNIDSALSLAGDWHPEVARSLLLAALLLTGMGDALRRQLPEGEDSGVVRLEELPLLMFEEYS